MRAARSLALLALLCTACNPRAPTGSCRSQAKGFCADMGDMGGDWTAADSQSECASLPGTYSSGPCDVSGALAGCELHSRSAFDVDVYLETQWYWPGSTVFGSTPITTAADVRAFCPPEDFELPDGTFPERR
jgi:hypothetical protein